MGPHIKTITGWIMGPLLIFGFYTLANGHLVPGEGFGAGILIAAALILYLLVYGREALERKISRSAAQTIGALSLSALLALGSWGSMNNYTIPALNILTGLLVGMLLYLTVIALLEKK